MSVHRFAAKRDANEPDIIKALRAQGCVVWQLSGKGLPDLLVLRNGKKWLADVKMPGKPTTEAQEELWEEAATKAQCVVFILRTPEDAAAMLNGGLQWWEPAPWCQTPGCIHRGACPEARPRSTPLPGGHVKRHRCGKDGCRLLRPCATHDGTMKAEKISGSIRAPRPHGDGRRPKAGDAAGAPKRRGRKVEFNDAMDAVFAHRLDAGYTPPRSKPVDAAPTYSGSLGDAVRDFEKKRALDAAKPKGMGMHIHDQDPKWLKERVERSMDAAKEAEATFAPLGLPPCCGRYEAHGEHDAWCERAGDA